MLSAIFLQHRVEDVPAIDAAPAFHPPLTAAFLKIKEMIPRHASLTPSTSHGDLLWFCDTLQD
jgi:predicted benzoate:H+ symporter BenE